MHLRLQCKIMIRLILSFVILLTLMIACGFKGPLYLPPKNSDNHVTKVTNKVESSSRTSIVYESKSIESR